MFWELLWARVQLASEAFIIYPPTLNPLNRLSKTREPPNTCSYPFTYFYPDLAIYPVKTYPAKECHISQLSQKPRLVVGTSQRQDRSLFNIFSSTLTSFHRLLHLSVLHSQETIESGRERERGREGTREKRERGMESEQQPQGAPASVPSPAMAMEDTLASVQRSLVLLHQLHCSVSSFTMPSQLLLLERL
jgi:hypothetical protein